MTSPHDTDAAPLDLPVDGTELATYIAAKLCHDFISPSGAIVSGLDLMQDPTAQDMRDDALALIEQSARKMVALVHFARVAFGAATTSEKFTAREIEGLVSGMVQGGRASLDWRIADGEFTKPQARALTNLAYLTVGALPMGGVATIQSRLESGLLYLEGFAEGARARLKPEVVTGLAGERLVEGLAGQWIQPYWLWLTVNEAGGALRVKVEDGKVALVARMPA
ncbi:histidine phosphotransferase [Brevundimonas sp. Leaf280]|jgi:histidine phosphotransferase ChpT|uniref:histidine phosphotransferase ChpT n=1 Tax=Brevundimonas sp. Leaf280 TaxID=1736320 RepID=UPI0006FBE350|nr:histidine phosphotransferase family protein [Brevundimonas sp. Leaf280]KQP45691.1 histidine phosphotransferase [Brevundimonas sp. Leaf280]